MFKTLTTLLLLSSTAAWAHDGAAAGQFGGQVAAAGDWHVEFAIRDGGVRAWVRDHGDKAVAATGKATLLSGGQKLELALKPDGEALVADAAALQSAAKVTAVLALTVAGKPVSARFAQEALVKPALSPSAQAGAKVFGEVCLACHGTALRGSDAGPPLLHPYYAPGAGHGDDVVLAAIANGAASHHWKFGDMPKPEGIKPGQDKDLLAYIRAMQAANGLGAAAPMDHSAHAMH